MDTENNFKILVVEDDESIRRFVVINLEREKFKVLETTFGEEAITKAKEEKPHLMVLDIMLPDIDGFEVCRRLREENPKIAVILLTARGQDMDKIMGLELGADDYIVKPFNPLELVARIRAVLRRTSTSKQMETNDDLLSGPFKWSHESNQLFKHNKPIELTPKELLLMKVFMKYSNKAFSRDELLNHVWGEDYVGDPKTVDVHVRRLREKIEDKDSKQKFIETIWGLGYRWRKVDSIDERN